MRNSPYGYDIPEGHRGRMPDGRWMLFSTRKEYEELFYEEVVEHQSRNQNENPGIFATLQRTANAVS